jgi:hypothetical protein
MRRFVEVSHEESIAAPIATVRAQFADLHHHIAANVHPGLRFEILSLGDHCARFVQEVRLMGIKQRDVFERVVAADGLSMVDTSVEGFNQGGSLSFRFTPEIGAGREATRVSVTVRLPVPRFMGLLAPLMEAQVRRELSAAVLQDKHDIEVRGYPRRRAPAVATTAATLAH